MARAAAVRDDPALDRRDLEPPHPAFAGFRRATYVWREGASLEPVGDRIELWIDFLADRGTTRVWLDVLNGEPAGRAEHPGGVDAWRATWDELGFTVLGGPEAAPPAAGPGLEAAESSLRAAVTAAVAAGPDAVSRLELDRALAILGAEGDGEEVSDVAWPYFLLPAGYGIAARRLVAAAAGPDSGWDGELGRAALSAVAAAVNSLPLK